MHSSAMWIWTYLFACAILKVCSCYVSVCSFTIAELAEPFIVNLIEIAFLIKFKLAHFWCKQCVLQICFIVVTMCLVNWYNFYASVHNINNCIIAFGINSFSTLFLFFSLMYLIYGIFQ